MAGPGLGRVITDGFYRTNYGKGVAGAIVVAVVALVLEVLAALGQRLLDPSVRASSPRRHPGMPVDVPRVTEAADVVGR